MVPEGVTLPILPTPFSVNQRLPSGPVVMSCGLLPPEGVANSVIVWTTVLMVSIACADVRPVALAVMVGLAIAAPLWLKVIHEVGALSELCERCVAPEPS